MMIWEKCIEFRNKMISYLKAHKSDKYFYMRCVLTLLLLGIFSFHHYKFTLNFKSGTTPSYIKFFFAGKGGFSEKDSFYVRDSRKFSFSTFTLMKSFRVDIEKPKYGYYDLESLKINNITYSGKDLYRMIRRTNFIKVELIDNVCRLKLDFPDKGDYEEGSFPDLDYYFACRTFMPWNRLDFAGTLFFLKFLVFGVLLFFVWCDLKVWRCIWTGITFLRHSWKIMPELLFLLMIASFLLLRPALHRLPELDIMLIMLRSDMDLVFILSGCTIICYLLRSKIAAGLLWTGLMILYVFCFADCFLFYQFNTRICVIESVNWVSNLKWTLPIIFQSFRTHYFLFEVLIVLSTTLLFVLTFFREKKQNIRFLIFAAVITACGIVYRLLPAPHNIFEIDYLNVFAYGMNHKMYLPYSQKYLDSVAPFKLQYRQEKGRALNRNTILLAVESLSSFQSQLFSGLGKDNMPFFDSCVSGKSIFSRKYLSSSYNTTCGTFSLLTGFSPVHAPKVHFDFKNPKYYRKPLPVMFREHGYETVFMTSSKLVDFMDVVVEGSKFDLFLGDEDPFYKNAQRYVFNSVSDEIFLKRLLEYVKNASLEKKYFIYAQTISMHAPFYDHRTKKYSYEETVKTFDLFFPDFMRELEKTGFFENGGVLIVTGDHRAMVTIGTKEQQKMGDYVSQYVPLAVFGDVPAKLDDTGYYNHVDLQYSLQYLMLDEATGHQYQRNIFAPGKEGSFHCAFFQQRTNPSLVLLQSGDKKGVIRLSGDNTSIKIKGLTKQECEKINSFLVWSRTP